VIAGTCACRRGCGSERSARLNKNIGKPAWACSLELEARPEVSAPPSAMTDSRFWHLRPRCWLCTVHLSRVQAVGLQSRKQLVTDTHRKIDSAALGNSPSASPGRIQMSLI
jgi:hypothetical protein